MIEYLKNLTIYYLVIIFLISLLILGVYSFGFTQVLFQVIPPIMAAVATDSILKYLKLKTWNFSLSALITGLIIGLTAQFGAEVWILGLIAVLAILSKVLLKLDGKHIFNPAATGLFIVMILFSSSPSWWGGSGFPQAFLIWLPILIYKLKRWAPIVGFTVPAILGSGIGILTSGSALFFMSIMLIEPKTSPFQTKLGLIYGLITGVGYIVFSQTNFDPFIPSLLSANLGARLLGKVIV